MALISDLGFELFGDRATKEPLYFAADFFVPDYVESTRGRLLALAPESRGFFDVVFLGSILHLFDEPQVSPDTCVVLICLYTQVALVLSRVVQLLRPGTGQLIGHTRGRRVGPGERPRAVCEGGPSMRIWAVSDLPVAISN